MLIQNKDVEMKFGAFFFGGVEMTDAGAGLPNPMDRRYDNAACWKATLDYIDTAVEATRIGAMAFLEKPITLQKLLKAVEQGLARTIARPAMTPNAVAVQPGEFPLEAALQGSIMATPIDKGPQALQSFLLEKPLREARDEFEKAYFEFHLAKEGGSMTRVAEKTGLERTHLYRKLKQLGVDLTRGKRSV